MKRLCKCIELSRIAVARARANLFRFLGARIGAKCLFFKNLRMDRAWAVSVGKRCVFEEGVWLDIVSDNATCEIGDSCFVGRGTHIFVSDRVEIGSHAMIGDGVIISDHKHNTEPKKVIHEQGCNSSPIRIGRDVLICVRSVILQGVTIGDGAIIGPNSVVTTDVPENGIVGSMPGRVIGKRGSGC